MADAQPEQQAVARELGRLCHSVDQFGRDLGDIKTACAVLVERSDRNEQDVRQLRADTEKDDEAIRADVQDLRREVEALKSRRWPLATIAVVAGVASVVVGAVAVVVTLMVQ